MTPSAQFAFHSITKEIGALSLGFLASVVAMVAAIVFRRYNGLVIAAYFLGAAALGALSIGHEYSHRTVSLLLSQPARRQRLLLVKLGVLAAMLLALGQVAGVAFPHVLAPSQRLAFALLPMLGGLFVAPWLTMVCRSPIAGTVFTIAVPGVLVTVSQRLYVVAYGREPSTDFEMAVLWRGMLVLCAIGAVMSWRMFMRLEAIDGRGPDVRLPQWLRVRFTASEIVSVTKQHRIWLLVRKEIHLQQMAPVVAGLYLVGWLTLVRPRVHDVDDAFNVLTVFYGAMLSMLIGSLASADERQLGTLEWQLLLPVAAWKQWAVKVGTVLALALLLAFGVPAMLAFANPALDMGRFVRPEPAAAVAVLTIGSLYVSSLNTSGLRALLVSLPAIVVAVLFLEFLFEYPGAAVFAIISRQFSGVAAPVAIRTTQLRLMGWLRLLLSVGFLVMVLRLALTNHQSADRTAARVWTQVIWMVFCVTIGVTLLASAAALSRLSLF